MKVDHVGGANEHGASEPEMDRTSLLRWLAIVSMAAAVVVCALVYLSKQPSGSKPLF